MDGSLIQIASAVRAGRQRAREHVDAALDRIATGDGELRAFCAIDADAARAAADLIDARVARGDDPGPLAGVPFGVKDLEAAAGFVTTFGDPARAQDAPAAAHSVQVQRMVDAGGVVVGKTNTPAYGFHAETENLLHGPTRNPRALGRTSGGSSGGSAAAVAAGLVPLCTGSDGGGSIRIPSAVCGIPGFKVTHGVVPNGDADAPTWGPFSTRGPMARTFADIAYVLDIVRGASVRDVLSLEIAGSFATAATRGAAAELTGLRVAWSPTLGFARPDARIVEQCERALRALESRGAVVETVDRVFSEPPVLAWLARAAPGSKRTASRDPMPWDGRFLPAAQLTAVLGASTTVEQMLDGESRAQRLNLELATVWDRYDVLVTPACAALPPRIGESSNYGPGWASEYTVGFNLLRSPAAVVPCGTVDDDGDTLPVAIQLAMPRLADVRLMAFAAAAEALLH